MTGQCSELILLIWSVWSGYRAIRVLYLPSCTIPSSLSQCSVSPSLSLTINNITTSDNHTASYRTSHTHFTRPQSLPSHFTHLCPSCHLSGAFSQQKQYNGRFQIFRYFTTISANIVQGKNSSLQYICYLNSNLRLSFCISIYFWYICEMSEYNFYYSRVGAYLFLKYAGLM